MGHIGRRKGRMDEKPDYITCLINDQTNDNSSISPATDAFLPSGGAKPLLALM
jgi:hypothetical protein